MKMLLDAIQFANEKHSGQIRRSSGAPYVTHTLAVSYLVAAYKRSARLPDLLAASILHDCLEDTDATFGDLADRFTPLVASLVLELTNDAEMIAKLGKLDYQTKKLLGMSSYALIIKLCDRLHNITDSPTPKMVADTLVLMQRLRAGRTLTRPQLELVNAIEGICKEHEAAEAA